MSQKVRVRLALQTARESLPASLMSDRNLGDVHCTLRGALFVRARRPRNLLGARGVNGALASNVMSHCGSPARIWKYLCWSQSGNYKVWGIYGTANNNQTGVVSGMVWCTVYLHSTCLSFAVHGKSNVRSISVLAQPSIYRLFVCLLICWHLLHYCYINNSFTLWMSLE